MKCDTMIRCPACGTAMPVTLGAPYGWGVTTTVPVVVDTRHDCPAMPPRCFKTADGADETYHLFCDREVGHDGPCSDPLFGDFDGD